MKKGRIAASARVGILALLMIHAQGGPALAGALERAMIGKSPIVDLTRSAPETAAGAEAPPGAAAAPATRLYAPVGSLPGRRTVAQIAVRELLLHAVVIDIAGKVSQQADYRLGMEDLRAWERKYGRIPRRSAVLLRTAMRAASGEADPFRPAGSAPAPSPGFQPAALAFLLQQRDIRAVGQDGPMVHPALPGSADATPAGRAATIQVEHLTNLDRLPAKGAKLIIAPLRLAEESAPARVIAILP